MDYKEMLAQLPGYDSFKKEIEDKVSDIRMEKNRGGNMGRFSIIISLWATLWQI